MWFMTFWLVQPGAKTCRHTFPLATVQCNAISEFVAGLLSTEAFEIVGGCTSRKHAYIILTPLNPTFI